MMPSVAARKQALLLIRQVQFTKRCRSRFSDAKYLWDIPLRNYTVPSSLPGSGAGKGGGGGGSVRESGGGLGKYGAAQEEGYFHHKQREQLQKIKKQIKEGYDLNQKPPK